MSHRFRLAPRAALLAFLALVPVASAAQSINVTVDAALDRKAINPRIYGVSHASTAQLKDLRIKFNRSGGNNTSRYNWQENADNRGSDWFFQSVPLNGPAPGGEGDMFMAQTLAAGAEATLTIPMIDWIAKLGPGRTKLASFSRAKYGDQTAYDWSYFPDAGNGISAATGQPITGNDPNDANVPNSVAFQQGWVQHLMSTWGSAAAGGLRWYTLDNEPSIWHGTHRDVRPNAPGMDDIRDRIIAYGTMIKDLDPTAKTIGPEEWGWSGYFYSGKDQQYGNVNGWGGPLPDRTAHGGWDYLPYLLDQLRQNHQATGRRLLDVFSVHYYPQGGEFSNDTSANMQLLRNRSTRALWDATYTDQSWIGTQVQLIPRLRGWVNTYYPGTEVGLTEYNWGALHHINGATTQADILGIFGREGLDMAALWIAPDQGWLGHRAIKLFTNYDDRGSTFGDTNVRTVAGSNPDNVAFYSAQRGYDGALTIMAINKVGTASTANFSLANFATHATRGRAQVFRLNAVNRIAREADITVSGNSFSASLPAQSITLFVINPTMTGTPGTPANLTATRGVKSVRLAWRQQQDATLYNVKRSTTPGGPYLDIAPGIQTTEYVDTAVQAGVTYYYIVNAVPFSGTPSPFTSEVSATVVNPTNVANFLGVDATTQGNWKGKYGAQGYAIAEHGSSLPAYATLNLSGHYGHTWAASTTDARALQKTGAGTDRVASTWYSSSTFDVNLNLTDNAVHQVSFYLLDWEGVNRLVNIEILDAATNALLDSRTVDLMGSTAKYAKWNLSGNIKARFSYSGGSNAVLAGVFIDGGLTTSSAEFLGTDTATQGTWKGVYGADGYNIPQDHASPAKYATYTMSGESPFTWAASTTDVRGTQKALSTGRQATAWYSGAITIDLNITADSPRHVAMYFLDWDNLGRAVKADIRDFTTNELLSTQSVTNYSGGIYFKWNIKGRVKITLTQTGVGNATLSGLFFGLATKSPPNAPTNLTATPGDGKVDLAWTDAQDVKYTVKRSTTSGGPYTTIASNLLTTTYSDTSVGGGTTYYYVVTAVHALGGESPNSNEASATTPGPTATFLGTDTTTKGDWRTKYGADGYMIPKDGVLKPSYATASFNGESPHTWAASTADVRALTKAASATDRIASCWYNGTFTLDLNVTGPDAKQVSLYFLDWDGTGRIEKVEIFDAVTNALINTQTVSGFSGGTYFKWSIKGKVRIKVTRTAGPNAVLSGVFFGEGSGTPQAPMAPTGLSATPGNAQVGLAWTASTGATYYNVKRSTTSGSGYTQVASSISGTSYTDLTAVNGTTYYYVVTAVNAGGESPNSNEASATPQAPAATASFLGTDTTTKGDWKGVYGADGYMIPRDGVLRPAYATASFTGESPYTWVASTSDVRALLKAASAMDRIASCWYNTTFTLDLNVTGADAKQVSLYFLDWDASGRAVKVEVFDAVTNALLSTQNVSGYSGGTYLKWSVKGKVKVKLTRTGGPNATLSGVFFQ